MARSGAKEKKAPKKPAKPKRDDVERSRRRFARRQWARRWLTWRYILATVVLVGVVGGGTYLVYFSDTLSVQDVNVSGTDTLTANQVLTAAQVPKGGPLATVDLTAIQRRVSALATVRSADVTRQWPHSVHITIVERTPVAVVQVGGQLRGLDATGVVFNSYTSPPSGLPRVETASAASNGLDDGLKQAALVVSALPNSLRVLTDHVELVSPDDIELALTDDRTVRWGSSDESAEKAEVLATLLQRKAVYYDVSVPGAPVSSDQQPG